ncbi:putative disease resistance protein RGA3, partial [Triticum urartu]|uniref:putative disease resistance protein RGA3 n=1 Tax=Triticum urartu TaxID=4572 RepID=UPI0020440CD4
MFYFVENVTSAKDALEPGHHIVGIEVHTAAHAMMKPLAASVLTESQRSSAHSLRGIRLSMSTGDGGSSDIATDGPWCLHRPMKLLLPDLLRLVLLAEDVTHCEETLGAKLHGKDEEVEKLFAQKHKEVLEAHATDHAGKLKEAVFAAKAAEAAKNELEGKVKKLEADLEVHGKEIATLKADREKTLYDLAEMQNFISTKTQDLSKAHEAIADLMLKVRTHEKNLEESRAQEKILIKDLQNKKDLVASAASTYNSFQKGMKIKTERLVDATQKLTAQLSSMGLVGQRNLQPPQCLSFCALFPEDYEFHAKELVHLWIGLGILHSDDEKRRIEDVGLCYLTDLVNQGFFKKNESRLGGPYYTIHDLLRELVAKVSSYECLSISSSNVMCIEIPPFVRHLSIIVDDADVKDTMTFENYKRDLCALEKRLEVQNLHTLMLFGQYHGTFSRVFCGLFREARALRTVFLSDASYNLEDVLPNFSKLVHLRYFKLAGFGDDKGLCVAGVLCRLYHLEVIDLQGWRGRFGSTRHISTLVKLGHFVVPREELHSDIFEVGKLKFINELKTFRVGQESNMFELSQLGKLENIGGLLGIYNLEKVQSEEEATKSRLIHKSHMQELILEWYVQRSNRDPTFEENVLERLVPHSNLQHLYIKGHGGTNCPRWLGVNLSIKNLESLYLYDLSWGNLPPLGEMWMVNDLGAVYKDCILGQGFQNLKRLELVKIPRLRKWVGDNNTCHLFYHLEELTIEDCSELTELCFPDLSCGLRQQEKSISWFPRLKSLGIHNCPKLLSLPPIPWTCGPCSAVINRVGSGLERLVYKEDSTSSLEVQGTYGQDSVFFNGLVFSNLTYLKTLVMQSCSPLLLDRLLMLKSLESLQISNSSNILSMVESVGHVRCQLPVKRLSVEQCGGSGKELTLLFSLMPELTQITIGRCQGIKWLGVGQSSVYSSAEPLHKV